MFPGLNDTDAQAASVQHEQMVSRGQYQQSVAITLATTSRPRMAPVTVRPRLRMLLAWASQRFSGTKSVAGARCAATAPSELGSVA